MKIFLSWSGNQSGAAADLLHEWLPQVIQSLQTWKSNHSIEKGSLWDQAITGELKDSYYGIVCLTKFNLSAPWLLFEAGSLYKGDTSTRVCTFLVGVEPKDVSQPLSKFQNTRSTKEDVFKLVKQLNTALPIPLDLKVLEKSFEIHWPEFAARMGNILGMSPEGKSETRSSEQLLTDILETVRRLERNASEGITIPPLPSIVRVKTEQSSLSAAKNKLVKLINLEISEMELPKGIESALERAKITKIGSLISCTPGELTKLKGLNEAKVRMIDFKLEGLGLSLGMQLSPEVW